MVERWSPQADQKDISHFNIVANPVGGGAISPTLHYPRAHYSIIPIFHHSNRERSELTYRLPFSDFDMRGFLLHVFCTNAFKILATAATLSIIPRLKIYIDQLFNMFSQ